MSTEQTVALVTGANRGLGRRFAAQLVERGAKVYAAARRPETIDVPGVVPVQLDITDPESVARAAGFAGDVNVLINNAGVSAGASLLAGPSSTPPRRSPTTRRVSRPGSRCTSTATWAGRPASGTASLR